MLGRTFDERDDRPHAPEVVVLSYAAWQRLLGGDPGAIGKAVTVDKQAATVIGVMPKEFEFEAGVDMWRPAHFDPAGWRSYRGDGTRFINVMGRLKPGISAATMHNELGVIDAQLAREHPETDGPWRFRSTSLRDDLYGTMKPALAVLMAASTTLLLIACVNVANLMFSRATARRREVALRQALGASHGRVVRQLLTESVLLAMLGGGAGLAAAWALIRLAATGLHGVFRVQGEFRWTGTSSVLRWGFR